MSDLDMIRQRAGDAKALHGCSSDPCGSVVCQTARDRDTLLDRLETAEATIQRVRELHGTDEYGTCENCSDREGWAVPHPCDTIKALDGAE